MRRNSSNLSRCAAMRASSGVSGRWMRQNASVRSTSLCARLTSASSGSANPRCLVRSSAARTMPRQLPAVHVRLARRRVHRHDRAGLVAELAQHVDDGVGHLPLAPEEVDLAEERRLRALGELLLAERLVEEHDVQEPGSVVDVGLDHRAATVAHRPRADPADLGVDRHLDPELDLRDLRPVRTVVVATRVVRQQIENRRDLHRRQPRRELRTHVAQVAHRPRAQVAEREAALGRRRHRAATRRR